jgi:hypothetical protein
MTSKINKDKTKSKPHTQDSIPSFIRKTYDILEERKFPDIIDWNPEGTALVIKKPAEFCLKVLPAYFKHNNLTSFVRQLNMYNFHKRRTQNIDHVYYHELFQKGKKHLLKDIKRKNHEHALEKAQKAAENLENAQNGKDYSSLAYENQFLKRLYNDAMTKIAGLESQVKDLNQQNQSLWTQACQQNGGEVSIKPAMAKLEGDEMGQEQISAPFTELSIPPLKLEADNQIPGQPMWTYNPSSQIGVCYAKMKDESGDSTTTEPSHNSPNQMGENEKCYDFSDVTRVAQPIHLQGQNYAKELLITKKETSIGQLFSSWDTETDPCLVKKRHLDSENVNREARPYGMDTRLRRNDLCIFNRKGLISTGTEEKDLMGISMARESLGNEEYDCVDLMDFNQPFCG